MSTFEATLEQLPKPILDKLQSIIWRVRRLLIVRGIFATLAVGLLCLLSIMAIDATVTIFSQMIRWGMTLLGLLITVGAGWWYLVRPLSRKLSLTHVARILEVRHPELQERISTAVELLSSKDPEEIKGSEELIKAVVDSAVLDVQNISPRHEFKGVRAMKFVKLTALCIAALATVLLVFPNHGWKLLARAVAPFLNIGNAYADTMVVSPGNTRIAKGRELTVEMQIRHDKLRRAELRRILPDGSESVERMTLMGKTEDGAQKFSITFPGVQEDFKYRVRAGIAVSEYYQVEAVPPPVVEKRTIRYDYPEYTGLGSREEESTSGEIRAVTHTSVTITSLVNKEVWKAKTILNNADELGETDIEKNIVTTTFPLKNSTNGTWRLDLEDLDEFTNERLPFPIQSLPDKAPAIRITNPTFSQLRLKPVEVLPMEFDITEDFGFSEVALLVTPNGETSPRIIVQSPPSRDEKSGIWKGNASLNLALLKLEPQHNQLQVQVRARDNRPANFDGPGEGLSESIIILIDQNAKSLAEQTIEAQKKDLTEAIRQVRDDLERAKGDIANAERELSKKDEVTPEAERDLERFRQEAKEAGDAIKEVAEKLENSVFKPQTEALQDIAKDEITKARESADMIPVTDEKKERLKEAAKARDEVAQALNKLQDVEKSIQKSETDLRAIAQLNEMANEQRKLAQEAADRAQENAPTNPQQEEQAMNEFQRKQEKVQQNLGELLKDNAAALKEILEKQKEQAESLADEAKQLAKDQKDLKDLADVAKAKPDSQQKAELQEQIMNQLQEQQKQIAQETAEVQKELAAAEKNQAAQNAEQKATPQAKTPPALKEAAKKTQSAAESLAKENLEKAGESAKEAAEALAEAAQEAASPESTPATGEQAAEMAKTPQPQNPADGAQQAQAAAQAPKPAAGEKTAEMAQNQQPQNPSDAPKPAAGEKAAEMAQNQQPQNPADAAQQAAASPQTPAAGDQPKPAAGEKTAEMAQTQQPQNPADAAQQPAAGEPGAEMADTPPPTNPAMEAAADALSELAERQEAISEQIESVKAGNLQEALAQMEEQLAAQSEGLENQAESLSKALENLKQNQSRYEANHAANFLKSAANQAQQASQSFDQAQQAQSQAESQGAVPPGQTAPQAQQAMARAQQNQQQAQRSMETAANSLEKASDAISKSLKSLKPSENDERLADSEQMAESFEDLSQSAQSENAGEAAQNSQQAAQSLQELAQQAMKQLGNMGQQGQQEPGQPSQQQSQEMTEGQPKGNQPNEGGKSADASGDGIPPELKELGITAKDWARFKGALAGGNANAIDTNLPSEYRELVGRYFQVIAKEANGGAK